jgi:hypothetical protein
MPNPVLGTSGIDFNNAITHAIQTRQYNPALSQYGAWTNMSPDGDQGNYAFTSNNTRLNDDGTIKGPNGEQLVQVGGFHRPDRDSEGGMHFDHVTDDSRVTYDPEFGYVTTADNISRNDGTFFDQYGGWMLAAPALAATGAAALGGAAAPATAGGNAFAGGTAAGEVTAGGTTAFTGGTAAGEVAGGNAFAGGAASAEAGTGAAGTTGAASTGAGATGAASVPAGGATPLGATGTGGSSSGIISGGTDAFAGGVAGAESGFSTPAWYNSLSPLSRQILSSAISTGARAAIASHAQQNQINAQQQADERARQDRIRRGHIDAFAPNSFTPRGIIGGAQGGG